MIEEELIFFMNGKKSESNKSSFEIQTSSHSHVLRCEIWGCCRKSVRIHFYPPPPHTLSLADEMASKSLEIQYIYGYRVSPGQYFAFYEPPCVGDLLVRMLFQGL